MLEKTLKILICDDSSLLRKKLTQELESRNCEVMEAKNGKEAVMMFLKERPHGIFMDIVMPEVGGMEALKAIREIDKKAYVVMLSSAGTSAKLLESVKLGAVDFIQKPYTVEQIEKALTDLRKKVDSNA
ncbi:MAG: putative chemotaxis response regulator [Massilibacillus sp.]|nr:putative chemotaxis response regulator [Massilibacillus sp.]